MGWLLQGPIFQPAHMREEFTVDAWTRVFEFKKWQKHHHSTYAILFKLTNNKNKIIVDPVFFACVSTWWRNSLFILKNNLLKFWFGIATYFCFIFIWKNKIRKKTLNVTPKGKIGLQKKKIWIGSRGQITYWKGTVKIRSTSLSL